MSASGYVPPAEIEAELDDAFQFTEADGSRHSYVSRAWVEKLLAAATTAEREATVRAMYAGAANAVENAVAAEREKCAREAEQLGAQYWAHKDGQQGTYHPFGTWLREGCER